MKYVQSFHCICCRIKNTQNEKSKEGTNMLLVAKELGARSLAIWEQTSFCSSSLEDIFTAYVNQASCFTNLAKYHYKNEGCTYSSLRNISV